MMNSERWEGSSIMNFICNKFGKKKKIHRETELQLGLVTMKGGFEPVVVRRHSCYTGVSRAGRRKSLR